MIDLAAIRRETGLTQTELAASLGVGQAQVSKVERQGDMLISTLASYLAALGVDAKIVVRMGEEAAHTTSPPGGGMMTTRRSHPEESPPSSPIFWGLLIGAIAIRLRRQHHACAGRP